MKKPMFYKKLASLMLISLPLASVCFQSQAISLSTYRIYLGPDSRSASFIMYNKSADQEQCSISLVHNNFDKNGKMTLVADKELPANSAKSWIRYSPKNFIVEGREPQSVRFTLRRKANTEPNEYRSYLRVDCEKTSKSMNNSKSKNNNSANLTIKPRLIQQIPIIARTGKLDAKISFGNIKVIGGRVIFDLQRQGKRSIYGNMELINKKTDEVITYKRNVSVYAETDQVQHKLATNNVSLDLLMLRFTENDSYGGDIVVEKDVILK